MAYTKRQHQIDGLHKETASDRWPTQRQHQIDGLHIETASDRWPTHRETEGRCFARSEAFTIHSASCECKLHYGTQGRNIHYFIRFFMVNIMHTTVHNETIPVKLVLTVD
jgi:hypothetical protein